MLVVLTTQHLPSRHTQVKPKLPPEGSPSPSLWQRAWDGLDDRLKAGVNLRAGRRDIVEAVLGTAEEKKQLCLQKRWRIKKPNGEDIIVRDILEKIIVWLNKFKVIGDVAAQFDPTYTSLAWAGVSFVLQMAVGEQQVFGATVEDLETISHLITRYAIFETLYMHRTSSVRAELEAALTSLYAEVLIFLVNAKRFFQTSTAKRILKSAFQTAEDDQMMKIMAQEKRVSDLASMAGMEEQQHTGENVAAAQALLASLEAPILRMADQAAIFMRTLEEDKYLALLRWLSPVPYSCHHEAHAVKRVPGCGGWLLEHPQYRKWRGSSSSSVLLLHGIPGSGKTSLASSVVDSFLQDASKNISVAPLAYFYCSKSTFEPERSDPDEIMRSIVRQLAFTSGAQRKVRETFLMDYERREVEAKLDGFDIPKLRLAECVRLVLDLTLSNPTTIIVDAVDEVQETRLHQLLEALRQIAKESASVVKIFVTSRDSRKFLALLPDCLRVHIHPSDCRSDMDTFVRHHVALAIRSRRLLNGNVTEDLQEELIQTLLGGAKEMFLWVVLQIENLCRMKLEADVRAAMPKLSSDTLESLYADTFERISTGETFARKIAIQAFSLLMCLQEPLSPAAFLTAIAMADPHHRHLEFNLSDLLDTCFNLVVLDSKLNVLRFAHVSVQEFLESKPDLAPCCNHRLAAMSCLNVCTQYSPAETGLPLCSKEVFYHYGALYWAEHFRLAGATSGTDELFQTLKEFVFNDDEISLSFIGWIDDIREFSKALSRDHPLKTATGAAPSANYSPLFIACAFGLSDLIDEISRVQGFDWNEKNDLGHTGIYLASITGRESVVRSLIEFGADVNASGGKYGSPLQAACFAGHVGVVQQLITRGADPQLSGLFDNALVASLMGSHEDIALMILKNGFQISSQSEYDCILRQAAEAGFIEVVRFLQRAYMSTFGNSAPAQHRALEAAIMKGQLGVVDQFLRRSLHQNGLPTDAISIAALGGANDMIRSLLSRGLDMEREGPFGTPLRAASLMGHESTVRLLLDSGAQVNTRGSLGNALQASSMKGHISITKLLIQAGTNVNEEGGLYGNALQAAAYNGHQAVVEALLDAGANVQQRGIAMDAFHAAADAGHEQIVRLLLERGYKAPIRLGSPQFLPSSPCPYRDLLRESSPSRHDGIEKRHLDHIHSPNFPDRLHVSEYNLVLGSIKGKVSSVRESMQPYLTKRPHDIEKGPSLKVAVLKGHESLVKILLDHQRALNISDDDVGDALLEASRNGNNKIVELLISGNLDITPYLGSAITTAELHGHSAVVDGLLKYQGTNGPTEKAMIERDYKCVREALISGCSKGHFEIITRALDLMNDKISTVEVQKSHHDASKGPEEDDTSYTSFVRDSLSDALRQACTSGHNSAVLCLIENDKHNFLDASDYDLGFRIAIQEGHYELVYSFVVGGFGHQNTTVTDQTVLDTCLYGHADIVRLLLKNVEKNDSYPNILARCLSVASFGGHNRLVELLISEGADVNALVNISDAHTSSMEPSLYRRLMGLGLSTIHCDSEPHRPNPIDALQAAFSWLGLSERPYASSLWQQKEVEREETIKLLLENGANVNTLGSDIIYPLHLAALYCSPTVVQLLIDKGADVCQLTAQNETVLHFAARREKEAASMVRKLLGAGAVLPGGDAGEELISQTALKFFEKGTSHWDVASGRFLESKSVREVFDDGPGAVIKILLCQLPQAMAENEEYGMMLQMAAFVGDRQCIELLLQRQVNVNAAGHYYGSALQAAARQGNVEVVQLLLAAGADVNLLCGRHSTALRAAIIGGHAEVVDILINHGANIDLCLPEEEDYEQHPLSALHLAVKSRSHTIVKSLLAAGADVNTDSPNQPHALIMACRFGDAQVVQALLSAGAEVNVSGKIDSDWLPSSAPALDELDEVASLDELNEEASPLHVACAEGHISLIQLLLDHGADANREVKGAGTPLLATARTGNLAAVQVLLEAGANVNYHSNSSPLSEAAYHGHFHVVQELLIAGAIIADPPRIPNALRSAVAGPARHKHDHRLIVELLLDELAGTEKEEFIRIDALSVACDNHDSKMCKLLLNGIHWTLGILRNLCAAGLTDSVQDLLKMGVDINSDDGEDGHPLNVAAFYQQSAIVALLINHGADARVRSSKYGDPLLAALEGYSVPFLARWLSSEPGISLNFPDSESTSRLFSCIQDETRLYRARAPPSSLFAKPDRKKAIECQKIVECLLACGADIHTKPGAFGNSLHLASFTGNENIVRLLLDKGADVNSFGGFFETALLAALAGNHQTVVETLLSRGADANYSSDKHGTILHFACLHSNKKIVQTLLNHGADVNARCGEWDSPLAAALSRMSDEGNAISEILLNSKCGYLASQSDLAASVEYFSEDNGKCLRHLLEYGKTIRVSEDVIVAAVSRSLPVETVQLMLERGGDLGVTKAMLEAVKQPHLMKVLLRHKPICRITPAIAHSAATKFHGSELVQLLIAHCQDIPITEDVVISVLRTKSRHNKADGIPIMALLSRNNELQVTEAMIKAARRASDLKTLLERAPPEVSVTTDILEAAISTPTDDEVLELLLDHGKNLRIAPSLVLKAIEPITKPSAVNALLEHDPYLSITEETLIAALKCELYYSQVLIELFVRHKKQLRFTEKIRVAVNQSFPNTSQRKMKELCHELEKKDEEKRN